MEKVFLIRISHKLFEPVRKNSNTLKAASEDVCCIDVSELHTLAVDFSEYIMEDGVPVGVVLRCDCGRGYGFNNGTGVIEMRPGETAHFTYESNGVDDEGDPEYFSVDYYMELLEWDETSVVKKAFF